MPIRKKKHERLAADRTRFSAAFDAFCRDHDLGELEIDPDEIFDVRDYTSGANDFARFDVEVTRW